MPALGAPVASRPCSIRRSSRRTTCAGSIPTELDEDGAYAIGRAYVEQFEPRRIAVGRDMRLSSPAMAGGGDARAPRRPARTCSTSGWSARRWSISRSARSASTAAIDGHRLAQPEGVHGDEDRAPRRAAGRRRVGPPRRPRPRRVAATVARRRRAGRSREYDIWPAYVDRVLSFVDVAAIKPLRVVIDAANGMAGAMLPPVLERLPSRGGPLLLRAGRLVPEPRAEPAPAREPRVHRPQDARGGRRPRRRVRRRRRPLLLRRRHGRVRPRRLRDGAVRRDRAREGARREDHLRRARELGGAGHDRARRRRRRS